MENCIKDLNCITLKRDPNSSINKKAQDLIKYGMWPYNFKKTLEGIPTPVAPRFYGRLKDHKTDVPIRPIVSKSTPPTYFLEKKLFFPI